MHSEWLNKDNLYLLSLMITVNLPKILFEQHRNQAEWISAYLKIN